MEPLLEISAVSKTFDADRAPVEALRGISFEAMRGEWLCLVGPNGCGKTTLLQIIAGFLRASSGSVLIDGRAVASPGPDRPIILQDLGLFYWMTVWDNLTFGLGTRDRHASEALGVANLWLDRLGLRGFEDRYPFELSGGMQQKLAIGRAFVLDPKVLILDEPFANLDMQTREGMQEEVSQLAAAEGKTIIMVTHSVEEAIFLADRVLVLSQRPATITAVVPVGAERPRPRDFRFSEGFFALRARVSECLRQSQGG